MGGGKRVYVKLVGGPSDGRVRLDRDLPRHGCFIEPVLVDFNRSVERHEYNRTELSEAVWVRLIERAPAAIPMGPSTPR